MKRADDPRHQRRKIAVQEIFAYSFNKHRQLGTLANNIVKNLDRVDNLIGRCAKEWPIIKINKIDLAILRLAITEFIIKSAPKKVIIDEAVELAKTFGAESSPAFVNGVLGSAIKLIEEKKL